MKGPYKQGDILGVDIKGRHYLAYLESETATEVTVKPLTPNINSFTVSKQDVVGIWRHTRGKRPAFVSNRGGVRF